MVMETPCNRQIAAGGRAMVDQSILGVIGISLTMLPGRF